MGRGKVPDVIAPGLRVLFCGINPGLYSAQVGRHFARPGNRFWKALHGAGFTERLYGPEEQERLLEHGCGITNLVARETASADELDSAELVAGGRALARKVRRYRPAWVAVLGVTAYRAAFGERGAQVGAQPRRLAEAGLWVLPNPSGLNAHYQVDALARAFGELRQAAGKGSVARRAILKDNRPAPSRIRRYRDEDEAAVVEVWHRSGRAAYTYLPTWQAFDRAEALEVFRTSIAILCEIWVAEEGDRVVGFLAIRHGSYIDRLYIDPAAQRTRLGHTAPRARPEALARGLELHTHVENHAARALYEKHGFVAVRFGTSPRARSRRPTSNTIGDQEATSSRRVVARHSVEETTPIAESERPDRAASRWRGWRRRLAALRDETYALYLASRDPRTPWYAKLMVAAVVGYAASPIDLIPDFIPVLGQLDDLLLLPLGIGLAIRMIPREVMVEKRQAAAQRFSGAPPGGAGGEPPVAPADPTTSL